MVLDPSPPPLLYSELNSDQTCACFLKERDALVYWKRTNMGWLRLVGSFKLKVSFAKSPSKEMILCKRDVKFEGSLLVEATQ